jgi:hypothetical protein
LSVRFLGTTVGGATIDVGPFTHFAIDATTIHGFKAEEVEPVLLATRERANWLFEGKLALSSLDITDDEPSVVSPAAEVEEPRRKRGRRGGRRKKKVVDESLPPLPPVGLPAELEAA